MLLAQRPFTARALPFCSKVWWRCMRPIVVQLSVYCFQGIWWVLSGVDAIDLNSMCSHRWGEPSRRKASKFRRQLACRLTAGFCGRGETHSVALPLSSQVSLFFLCDKTAEIAETHTSFCPSVTAQWVRFRKKKGWRSHQTTWQAP